MVVRRRGGSRSAVAPFLYDVCGGNLPARVRAYDGSEAGPPDAPITVTLRSPDALRRFVQAPGELGLVRAYVAGNLDLAGDLFALVEVQDRLDTLRPSAAQLATAARLVGRDLLRRLPPPPEEARLRGRRHTPGRDAAAVTHHYDVSNRFYELLLGPAMTYSCAVFAGVDARAGGPAGLGAVEAPDDELADAQARKHELVCRKLGLRPGQRLLDVGCGWGSLARHAARHHGVRVVGVTISASQVAWAQQAVEAAGLGDRVEIRAQDYRDVDDGPYDAISSVGMFEHVGEAHTAVYLERLARLLRPGGRLLNHAISRPPGQRARTDPRGFMNRYVFPDGELLEVGRVVSAMQGTGLEVRHVESLREHYERTLRHWLANLEANWTEAVAEVGEGRARVWRLYLAGAAVNFRRAGISVHQVLAVRPNEVGASGMPLRPDWEPVHAARTATTEARADTTSGGLPEGANARSDYSSTSAAARSAIRSVS